MDKLPLKTAVIILGVRKEIGITANRRRAGYIISD